MQYKEYFKYRQITQEDYLDFELPTYLANVIATVTEPKILDFGCGFGQLICALKNAGFADVEGLDIEPDAITYCRSLGYICFDGSEEDNFYKKHKSYYDFIIMNHVLEHFPKEQIITQLSKMRDLLKPGGSLIVAVPNAQSNTGAYWAYEDFSHHTIFTSGSLYFALRAAGFNNIKFIDVDCCDGLILYKKIIKKLFLSAYKLNYYFWNIVTSSYIHKKSPLIFSYEIKVRARL